MKKQLIKLLSCLTLPFIFSNCVPQINSGIITQMRHEPERRYVNTYTTNLKVGDINFPMTTTTKMLDDEDWVIVFQKMLDKNVETRKIYATEKFYNSFKIGDSIDLSGYVEKPIPFEDYDFDVEVRR